MLPQSLTDPLRGKTSLGKVIWLYGFGASLVYTILGWILVPETPLGIGVYAVLGLALGVIQSIMLWKCAYNSSYPGAGRLLRFMVVVGMLALPLMLYILFRHPEALGTLD